MESSPCQKTPLDNNERHTRRKTKCVKYFRHVKVAQVRHLDEYSQEEVDAIWYDPDEYAKMKDECIVTVEINMDNEPLGPDRCWRGLEYRTHEGQRQRQKNKFSALYAVLDEQQAQWDQNINDEDAITAIYINHSVPCMEAARQMGIADEKYVLSLTHTRHRRSQTGHHQALLLEIINSSKDTRLREVEPTLKDVISPVPKTRNGVRNSRRILLHPAAA
jgi:hypothetical protein